MGDYIGIAIVIVLALLGCLQCIRWMVLRILTPAQKDKGIWLIPLSGNRPDAEYIIRCMAARRLWEPTGIAPKMFVVDTGLEHETRQAAQRICDESGAVEIIYTEDVIKMLQDADGTDKMIAFPKNM